MNARGSWNTLVLLAAGLLSTVTGCRFTPQHLAPPGTYGASRINFNAPEWSKRTANYFVHIDGRYVCGPSPDYKHEESSWFVPPGMEIHPADCGEGIGVPPGRHRIAAGFRSMTRETGLLGGVQEKYHYSPWSHAEISVPQSGEIECNLRGGSVVPGQYFNKHQEFTPLSITCTGVIGFGGSQ